MIEIFLEDSPRSQLIAGVFYLSAGLIILPSLVLVANKFNGWINRPESNRPDWKPYGLATSRIIRLALALNVLAGAGRLMVLFLVQIGLMASPWQ